VYVVFGGFDVEHVFQSTDAGTTWSDITGSLPDVPTTAIMVDPMNSDHLYVGNDISVYVSTDRGTTWGLLNAGIPEAVLISDLTMTASDRTIRATTHGNGVYQRSMLPPTSVESGTLAPSSFVLEQNFPNPFNPATTIRFTLHASLFTSLKIYNTLGQEVATLVNGVKQPGKHEVVWDASGQPSGIYYYSLKSGNAIEWKKMILIK